MHSRSGHLGVGTGISCSLLSLQRCTIARMELVEKAGQYLLWLCWSRIGDIYIGAVRVSHGLIGGVCPGMLTVAR